MRTLIILVALIVFFSISISSVYGGEVVSIPTNPSDTPTLNDLATAVLNPPVCVVPGAGDWTISSSCILVSSDTAPASVIVQNNSLLTIPSGVTLTVPSGHNITVVSGSGILIKSGGTLRITV